jgi:hypothetical protein
MGSNLARRGVSRSEAIEKIQATKEMATLTLLIQPGSSKYYAWNYDGLGDQRLSILETVEFRQPPGSRSAREALGWAELALAFVHVSVRHGTAEKLNGYPSNIKGLRRYLRLCDAPALADSEAMDDLWKGKDGNQFEKSIPVFGDHVPDPVLLKKLQDMAKQDLACMRERERWEGV